MTRQDAISALERQLTEDAALPSWPTWMQLEQSERATHRLTLEALLVLLKDESA